MKKLLILLVIGLVFLSCDDKEEKDDLGGNVTFYSICKNTTDTKFIGDSLIYNVSGDTLFIKKYNTFYNCCADSITISSNIQDNFINITEIESSTLCNCMCKRDLFYFIKDIPKGQYKVIINHDVDTLNININK